jgi:superfamily II DNA/RNA helicase
VLDQPPLADGEGPIALLMAPTRELAVQIFTEARKFAKALDLRVRPPARTACR